MSSRHPHPAPVAVVVVNYGSHRLLARNLTLAPDPRWRVYVVDNDSGPAEREAVTALAAERGWRLLAGDGNPGFGEAVNQAAAAARDDGCGALLMLNPDAVITAETLLELGRRVTVDDRLLTAPRLVDSAGGDYFRGSWLCLRDGRIRSRRPADARDAEWVPWLTGACLAMDLARFLRLGGFGSRYFLYWEDVDLSYRALRDGATLRVSEDLVVVHDEGGTQRESVGPARAKSATYYRYNTRNRLLFASRHVHGVARLRWLWTTPRVSWEILMRGGRRQLLHSPQLLWAALRGSAAGVAELARSSRRRGRDASTAAR